MESQKNNDEVYDKIKNFCITEQNNKKYKAIMTDDLLEKKMKHIGREDKFFAYNKFDYFNHVKETLCLESTEKSHRLEFTIKAGQNKNCVFKNFRFPKKSLKDFYRITLFIGGNNIDTVYSDIYDVIWELYYSDKSNTFIIDNEDYIQVPFDVLINGARSLEYHDIIVSFSKKNNFCEEEELFKLYYDVYITPENNDYLIDKIHQLQYNGPENITSNIMLRLNHVCSYLILSIVKKNNNQEQEISFEMPSVLNMKLIENKNEDTIPLQQVLKMNDTYVYDMYQFNCSRCDSLKIDLISHLYEENKYKVDNFSVCIYALSYQGIRHVSGMFGLEFSK